MTPKELLEQYLHKINWGLKHSGCDHYTIVDHSGKETEYVLWDTSIICKSDNVVTAFDIKEGNLKLIGSDAVSIGDDNSFVLFMNHGLSVPVETAEG